MVLDFSINIKRKKKKHNIKNKKLNYSLHTKKTNNINKLPFCPYKNSKITKLKKKKAFFVYGMPGIGRYARYMTGMSNI